MVRAALRLRSGVIFDGRVVGIDTRKVLDERRQVKQTTCNTLIITEKPAARVLVCCRGTGRTMHAQRELRDVQEIETTKRTDGQIEGSASPAEELGNPKHDE